MTTEAPECYDCAHFIKMDVPPGTVMHPRCKAFPDGIPHTIFFRGEPHHTLRGDEATPLTFQAKDGDAPQKTEGRRFHLSVKR